MSASSKRKVAVDAELSPEKRTKTSKKDGNVKVEIKFFGHTDQYDQPIDETEFDENNGGLFIDVSDEAGCDQFEFENFGWEGDYECVRKCNARVLLDDRKIGNIEFTLICRDNFGLGGNSLTFWDACDADSAELEQIATKFFEPDGTLKKALSKRLDDPHGMAHCGAFMYINEINLEAPYDRTANDEGVEVAAQAIDKLIHARTIQR